MVIILGEWILFQGSNSVKIVFVSVLKWVYSKRKEFAPRGSKFFPFCVDPFSEGAWNVEKQTINHKSCLPCKTWQKKMPSVSSPLKHFSFACVAKKLKKNFFSKNYTFLMFLLNVKKVKMAIEIAQADFSFCTIFG